jgi:hypothetical protein
MDPPLEISNGQWACGFCTFLNTNVLSICEVCGKSSDYRNSSIVDKEEATPQAPVVLTKDLAQLVEQVDAFSVMETRTLCDPPLEVNNEQWTCGFCTFLNSIVLSICEVCGKSAGNLNGNIEGKEEAAPQAPVVFTRQRSDDRRGNVEIFWDIENCPLPEHARCSALDAFKIANHIRSWARDSCGYFKEGGTLKFTCVQRQSVPAKYRVSAPQRKQFGEAGVTIVDVPSDKPNAVDDKLVELMNVFYRSTIKPASCVLISGDRDFAHVIRTMRDSGMNVRNIYLFVTLI